MTDRTVFIPHAFRTIARAVAETGVNTGLFRHPELNSKTLKRRVSAELKRLGVLLRRLIFLMALQVQLAPLTPRPARNCFEKTDGTPKPHKAFFSVLPVPATETPDFLHGPVIVPTRGPVPAAPVIARWDAMLDTLKHHKRRAKCLARTIQRWKAAGEARPYIAPIPKTHTMPAVLGIVSCQPGKLARLIGGSVPRSKLCTGSRRFATQIPGWARKGYRLTSNLSVFRSPISMRCSSRRRSAA